MANTHAYQNKNHSKTILLVEDEALIAINEASILKEHGFGVITAHNAQKAINAVKENKIDLILMDIDLGKGKLDGKEAAEIILQNHELPIVFLTSHAEKEYVDKAKEITNYGYVLKNSGEFVLIESINMAFSLFESNQKLREREKNLKKERDKYFILSETSPIPIVVVDKVGSITYANQEAQSALEIEKANITSRTFNDPKWKITDFKGKYFPDEKLPFSIVSRIQQPVYDVQHAVQTQSGEQKFLSINGSPLFDEGGEFDGMVAVLKDVTSEIRAQRQLKEYREFVNAILDNIKDGISVLNPDLSIRYVNSIMENRYEQQMPLVGKSCYRAYHDSDKPCDPCPSQRCIRSGNTEIEIIKGYTDFDSSEKSYEVISYPIKNPKNNEITGIIEFIKDITQCLETEKALKESENRYRTIIEESIDGIIILNKDGNIIDVNPAYCQMSGYSREELIAMSIKDLEAKESSEEIAEHTRIIREKGHDRFESIHKRKNCSHFPVDISSNYIETQELLLSFVRDISKRKDEEEKLKYTNALLSAQQEATIDGILVVDSNDKIVSYNKRFIDMWWIPKDIIESGYGDNALNYVVNMLPDADSFMKKVNYLYEHRHEKSKDEIELTDGRTFSRYSAPLFGKDDTYYGRLWLYRDITERKKVEEDRFESEEKYRLVFENSMDGILFTAPDGTIISANPKACELLESTEGELIDKGRESVVDLTDPRLPQALSLREKQGYFIGELLLKKKSGEVFPVELTSCIFRDRKNYRRSYISFREISELKKKENDLKKTIQEKEFLMKEINHRVKNNLLMISSLINLKDKSLSDAVDLSDISRQIDAIRIVHKKLNQSEDITHVNLKEYIQEIVSTVFSFSKKYVEVKNNIKNISIPTRTAIPIGLIVNEIATNAIKHGFTEEGEAVFTVELWKETSENQYVLRISNTGRPFPENINLDNPDTLGLQLISALVNQLDGTIELKRTPHPVFTIWFPVDSE